MPKRTTPRKDRAPKPTRQTDGKSKSTANRAGRKNPVLQGEDAEYRVGPGCPPREYQWRKGQSGNPNGRPPGKTYIRQYIVEYLKLTMAEIDKLKRKKGLTMSQLTAITLCEQVRAGVPRRGVSGLLKLLMEYDDGKPVETVAVERGDAMTSEECEQIRLEMRQRLGPSGPPQRHRGGKAASEGDRRR